MIRNLTKFAGAVAVVSVVVTGGNAAFAADDQFDTPEMKAADVLFQKQSPKAIAAFREIIRKQPENWKAHQRLGAALAGQVDAHSAKLSDYENAILEEKQAIKLNDKYFLPHVTLGQIYSNQQKFEDAVKEFKMAIQKKPDSYRSHLDLGVAYTYLDQNDNAIDAYKKAAELKPDEAVPFLNLGVLYQSKGDYANAIASEKKSIELNPKVAESHINLANIYAEQNKPDEAIESFKNALKINPDQPFAMSGVGWMLAKKGDYPAAISQQRKVLKQFQTFSVARSRLAQALAEQGNKSEAEKEFKACMAEKPKPNPICMVEYGKYLQGAGRNDEARNLYKGALEQLPSYKPAQDALASLGGK